MATKSIWYDWGRMFSYGGSGNGGFHTFIVIGARGIGKSYGAKRYALKKFYYENKQFVWIRDSEKALEKLKQNNGQKFFVDIKKDLTFLNNDDTKLVNDDHIINKNKVPTVIQQETIQVAGRHAGYLMPLSTFYNYKGNNYDDVKTIVFDEFMGEKGQRQSGDRLAEFFNTVETIGRLRTDYNIIMLANALNKSDPILTELGFKIKDYGYYFNRKRGIVLHYADNNPNFEKAKAKSIAGRLIRGTAFDDEILQNKFNDDDGQYFDKKPDKLKLLCILHTDYFSCRVYYKIDDPMLYVTKDFNIESCINYRYVTDINLVTSVRMLLPQNMKKALKDNFSNKKVMFENASVRNTFIEVLT